MPRKRYPVWKLKQRGPWRKLSREEQLRRLLLELPETLEAGQPTVPEGLNSKMQKDFLARCAELAAEGRLSKSDSPLIQQWVILKQVRNDEERERIEVAFRSRPLLQPVAPVDETSDTNEQLKLSKRRAPATKPDHERQTFKELENLLEALRR